MVCIASNAACGLGPVGGIGAQRWQWLLDGRGDAVIKRRSSVEWTSKARVSMRRIKERNPREDRGLGVVVKELGRGDPGSACVMYQRNTRAALRQAGEEAEGAAMIRTGWIAPLGPRACGVWVEGGEWMDGWMVEVRIGIIQLQEKCVMNSTYRKGSRCKERWCEVSVPGAGLR
ncbi:hypothetical protein LZ30DRAFT_378157 [Colletotrichum cereale]|nr:hypothetical protein LZ30DRAFT_378157 [Colletotrichum cereale]